MKTIVADVRVLRKLTQFLFHEGFRLDFLYLITEDLEEKYEGADVGRNHRIHGINLDASKEKEARWMGSSPPLETSFVFHELRYKKSYKENKQELNRIY